MWNEDVRPITIQAGRLMEYSKAAAVLDCDRRNIYRLINKNLLTPVRVGSRVYVTRKSVMALRDGE